MPRFKTKNVQTTKTYNLTPIAFTTIKVYKLNKG